MYWAGPMIVGFGSVRLTQSGGGEFAWLAVLGLELIFIGLMIVSVAIIKVIAFDILCEVLIVC